MSSHNAVPDPARPADPTLVPVPAPGLYPGADLPAEAGWHGGAVVPPALAAGPNAASLLKGLQRRWWVALFLGLLLAGGAAAGAWYLLEPQWTAKAQVHIEPVPPWLMHPHVDTVPDRNEFLNYERWQAAQMKSREVLSAARTHEEVKNLPVLREQPDPLQFLDQEIKIDYKEGDPVLPITMMGRDPQGVKAIVKAVRDEYFKLVVAREREDRKKKQKEVDSVVSETEQELHAKENQYHNMAKDHGLTDSGQLPIQQLEMRQTLRDRQRRLSEVQDRLLELRARARTYEEQAKDVKVPAPSEQDLAQALEADPVGHDLEQRREQWTTVVRRYEETLTNPNHYSIVNARATLREIERKLEQRRSELRTALGKGTVERARADLENGAKALQAEIATLVIEEGHRKAELQDLQKDQSTLGENSVELMQLQDEIQGLRGRLAELKKEQSSLKIELREGVPPRVTPVEDDAILQPRDQKKQIVATAAAPVLMLVLTCFGVGWWECRARRIHTADEVASGLGVRVVGAVPPLPNAARLAAAGELEENVHVHGLLESIDSIRTVLLRDAHAAETRVIMVTSAVSGEGKTTLASHLASSLARAGRRTLLIDCDLRRPSAHQLFELPLQPGFSEAVLGEVHVAEATLSTAVDGLWMIPAGQWDREVLQALARDGVDKLFEKLKNEYDFVVVDSHPVLPATDSLLIGQHVDAVILSVLRGVSQSPKVYAAAQRLATLGIRIVGAVVNGLPEDDVYTGGYQYAAPQPAAR